MFSFSLCFFCVCKIFSFSNVCTIFITDYFNFIHWWLLACSRDKYTFNWVKVHFRCKWLLKTLWVKVLGISFFNKTHGRSLRGLNNIRLNCSFQNKDFKICICKSHKEHYLQICKIAIKTHTTYTSSLHFCGFP